MKIARSAPWVPWLILLMALGVQPAMAVVIDSGDGSGNTSAPADDPGWSNVGVLGNTTGVYLGNHWVLTAGHGGARELQLGDRLFEAVQGKIRHRLSTAPAVEADLQLFQLRESPDLPALRLASSAPRVDTPVVMIGNGRNRSPSRTGWSLAWAIVPLSDASYAGYQPGPGRAMRWGTNRIAAVDLLTRTGKRVSRSFATRFDGGLPTPHEAQAATGDSGGPVFAKNGEGEWELVGIMITVSQQSESAGESSPSTAMSPSPSTSTRTGIRSRRSSPPHRITIATASSTSTTIARASRTPTRPTQTATAPATSVRSPRARRTRPPKAGEKRTRQ